MNFERKINKEKGMLGGRETKRKECWEEEEGKTKRGAQSSRTLAK